MGEVQAGEQVAADERVDVEEEEDVGRVRAAVCVAAEVVGDAVRKNAAANGRLEEAVVDKD